MRVFDLELPAEIVEAIAAHGERDYPVEACGVVLGSSTGVARAVAMKNVQDRYHQLDPAQFPRDGRDAFRFDELQRMRVLEEASKEGLEERVVYHSHCDAGAYFSPEDRAMAVHNDVEMVPGALHIVVSVRRGQRADMAAFRYAADRGAFEEQRLPLGVSLPMPELESRVLESRASSRPIRPAGGALALRRVTPAEQRALEEASEKAQIRIDDDAVLENLERLARGLLSPLAGFLRSVEVRSIEQSGRLLSGAAWRTPVTLELSAKKSAVFPATDALVQLVDRRGAPRAVLGLSEVVRVGKDAVRLAGPVFVFADADAGAQKDAADIRAELLRMGATRVLAVPPALNERADVEDLSGFDALLSTRGISAAPRSAELLLPGSDPWLNALMAQNQGATHIWVEDPVVSRSIEESLSILPWHPGAAIERRAGSVTALESVAP